MAMSIIYRRSRNSGKGANGHSFERDWNVSRLSNVIVVALGYEKAITNVTMT